MFRSVKQLKIDSKQGEGGTCMIGNDGKLCLSENREVESLMMNIIVIMI